MELTALYQRVIGLDVHQAKITACAIVEHNDGEIEIIEREFGAFKRDRRALAEWARELAPERVVMESTGTYWKSPYAALEKVGIHAMVVNARHAKGVPGRKTDIADARWLARLLRATGTDAAIAPGLPSTPETGGPVQRREEPTAQNSHRRRHRRRHSAQCRGLRYPRAGGTRHDQVADRRASPAEVLDRKGRLRASQELGGEHGRIQCGASLCGSGDSRAH